MKKVYILIILFFLSSPFVSAQWVSAGSGLGSYYGYNTALAFDSAGTPYVALSSGSSAYVFYLNGTQWHNLGTTKAANTGANGISMAMYHNSPLIAYQQTNNNNDAAAELYSPNAGAWQYFGAAPISTGYGFQPQIAIDSTGTANLIYIDIGINYLNNIGNGWNLVSTAESANLNHQDGSFFSLGLLMKGITPYVSFCDPYHGFRATVIYYNGSTWDTAGHAAFTDSSSAISMAIDTEGTLYLAAVPGYPNVPNSNYDRGIQVFKYDGTNWNALPSPFTGSALGFTDLAVSKQTNHLYIYYGDSTSNGASVSEYNGSTWQQVGAADFAPLADASLAIGPANVPYVSFVAGDSLQVLRFEGMVGVHEVSEENLTVYPNPTTHTLCINSPAAISLLQVYDISGQLVMQKANVNGGQIDMSGLANGFYQLKLVSNTNSYNRSFVKD